MGPPEWVAGSGSVGLWSSNLASVTAMSQHLGDHFATHSPNKNLEQRGIFHPKDLRMKTAQHTGSKGRLGTVHHGQRASAGTALSPGQLAEGTWKTRPNS